MSLTKVSYSMINTASVNIEDFGASRTGTGNQNYQALMDAITYVSANNGGEIFVPYMYDLGNNVVTIENGTLPVEATLNIRGRTMGALGYQPDPNASGFSSSATDILQFNAADPFERTLTLTDLRFQGTPNVTVNGLNFHNQGQNVAVILNNVHAANMEGANAVCINMGDSVDTNWTNVHVTGYNSQPNIGIKVERENSPISGGSIKYCRRGIQVGTNTTAYCRFTNFWVLVLAEAGVYMEAITSTRLNPTQFVNCFIGESTINSVQIFYGGDGGNYAEFVNCVFDRPANATKPGVEMLGAGRLSFINCGISIAVPQTFPDISAESSKVILLGLNNFGQDIITGQAQGRSSSIRAAGENQALELTNGTGMPVLGFRRIGQTVREGGIGFATSTNYLGFGNSTSGIICIGDAVIPGLVADTGIAGVDNGLSSGAAINRWSVVYAATGTIQTSDANQKQQIFDLTVAEQNTAKAIKNLIKTFKFNDAVDKKGSNARIHVGVIAQEVRDAFFINGLDANNYALFCSDVLETGEHRLGIRYDELLVFMIAAL